MDRAAATHTKGVAVLVVFPLERVYAVDETPLALGVPALDPLLADQPEPALDLVERGRVGRRAVQVIAWSRCQKSLNLGLFVRRVVVGDQVDIEISRHLPVDQAQER